MFIKEASFGLAPHFPLHCQSYTVNQLNRKALHFTSLEKKKEETEPPHTALSPASYVLTPHRMKCKTNGQPVTGPRAFDIHSTSEELLQKAAKFHI